MGVVVLSGPSEPAAIVNLARYRAARRLHQAQTVLTVPSPPGFAFLGLPDAAVLPAFMKPGFAVAGCRDV